MCIWNFEESKVENLRISSFLLFFILFPFPRLVYTRTPLARHPKNSALNPSAPGSVLIKNSPIIEFSLFFLRFCFDFSEFLMRQPLFLINRNVFLLTLIYHKKPRKTRYFYLYGCFVIFFDAKRSVRCWILL